MPRYFFDTCEDGRIAEDDEGIELPDIEAAKREAALSLVDLAHDVLPGSGKKREFSVEIKDHTGRRLLKTLLNFDIEID